MKQISQIHHPMITAWAALFLGASLGCPVLGGPEPDTLLASSGPAPKAISLEDAIRMALRHNPGLRVADERVRAATGRSAQAGLWQNPELEVSVEEWPVNSRRSFSDAKQTIGVTQTLPFPGKKALDRRIGRAGVNINASELQLRKVELVRDVKVAFYRVLATERLVEVSRELVRVADSAAATAQKRAEAGATPYQEQLRAEIQFEEVQIELDGIQRELEVARRILAKYLGEPKMEDAPLSGGLIEAPIVALLEGGVESWLAQHPSLSSAQAQLDQAQLEHRRARLAPYPDVSMGLAGGRLGDADQSIVEIRFSVPLPILDRAKGRQQETRANVTAAEAEVTATRQHLEREWANALQRYRAAAERVARYRDRVLPKATEALRLVQVGFDEGKFSFIDLLDTQRTTAQAQLTYQTQLLELSVAQAEIEALLHPLTNKFSIAQ